MPKKTMRCLRYCSGLLKGGGNLVNGRIPVIRGVFAVPALTGRTGDAPPQRVAFFCWRQALLQILTFPFSAFRSPLLA